VGRRGHQDIKAFGAPISDADAKVIADYLKQNYGGWARFSLAHRPAPSSDTAKIP